MPTSVCCRTPVGHDDPGVPRRSCPEQGMVAGGDPQQSTPIYLRLRATAARRLPPAHACGRSLFGAPKRKRRWRRQKKKRFSLRSYGRGAPPRAAGCDSKLSCSIDAASAGTRAGLSLDFRTQYAVLNKEVIGQNPNLTSDSFRAQSAAPGSRSGLPFRSVGADDLTDAPNFGTKFGRRRPCPRYGGPNPRPPQGKAPLCKGSCQPQAD